MDQKAGLKQDPMQGYNTLELCEAEMWQALQHYIDYRFGSGVAKVVKVQEQRDSVTIFRIGLCNNKV